MTTSVNFDCKGAASHLRFAVLEDLVSQLHLGGTPAWHKPRVPAQAADARNAVVHGALKVVQQRLRAVDEYQRKGGTGAEEMSDADSRRCSQKHNWRRK